MSSILSRNLDILGERFPLLAKQLAEGKLPDTRRTFVNERNVVVYQYSNGGKWNNLCSAYAPKLEAKKQLDSVDLADAKLIFIFGEAGFYHIEEVCRRAPIESRILLISHQPENVRLILESRDLSHVLCDARFEIVVSRNIEELKKTIDRIVNEDIYVIPTFTVVEHPIEATLDSGFHIKMQTLLHDSFTTLMANSNTAKAHEKWWAQNFVANLPYIIKATPLVRLNNTWSEKPVIIVAAGPSLNKNIHLLHQAKGKALIFCVDTAYRILEKHGIVPDMLFSLDGSPQNASHLSQCNYFNIPFMLDAYSHKDIYSNHRGPKVLLTSVQFHSGWYEQITGAPFQPDLISVGGSVSTAALSFSRWINADPVIMIGQDLSYPSGKWYADGALHDKLTTSDIQKHRPLYPVTDIYGEQTYTTFDYLFYLRWIQNQIKISDRVYINATEGGALREGVRIQTLEESLAENCAEEQPVLEWKALLEPQRFDSSRLMQIFHELKRSKIQLKAAASYLKLMLNEIALYIKELEHENIQRVNDHICYLKRANTKLNSLKLAQSYMDACSYSTVSSDKRLVESIEHDRDEYSISERALISARQMMVLYNQLLVIAKEGICNHDEGLKIFQEIFPSVLEGNNELSECI